MNARAEQRREQRFEAKGDAYLESGFWPAPSARMHGVCRRCSKRTYLWRPSRTCLKCIEHMAAWVWAANYLGVTL